MGSGGRGGPREAVVKIELILLAAVDEMQKDIQITFSFLGY